MTTPKLLEYHLSQDVRAFSTTRLGGVGGGAFASFNITHYCGDNFAHVKENRALLCQVLSIHDRQLILPRQVHGDKILCIDDKFLKLDDERRTEVLDGVDAVVTNIPQICIGVSTADCVPILLYDEVERVSAAVHAGWRGTVSKIISSTIRYMEVHFHCCPSHIRAVIGPSISLDAFEVGKEVYDAFRKVDFPMNSISRFYPSVQGDIVHHGQSGKWHIDLWAANCLLMEESGISLEHIQIANVCTFASSDSFFSARRLGLNSGRIYNGIVIK